VSWTERTSKVDIDLNEVIKVMKVMKGATETETETEARGRRI
jgi:hypothetical protein